MKSTFVIAFAILAIAAAAPPEPEKILRSHFDQEPAGGYVFGYELENGAVRDEKGELKEVVDAENKPHTVVVVRGSYSYRNTDGTLETVNYYADENGYKADGDSIPKLPAGR